MVTRASEGMQIVGILMRYMKIGELRRMLKEMLRDGRVPNVL